MKKKTNIAAILLFLTGTLFVAGLFGLGVTTYRHILATDQEIDAVKAQISAQQETMEKSAAVYTAAVEDARTTVNYLEQKEKLAHQDEGQIREHVETEDNGEASKPSVFSMAGAGGSLSGGSGHVIGIDPGHQAWDVDMSAQEPNGPGSSEMKARASTGTSGTYTGLPEYQLNLDISLKLRTELENRGYQVVMTRTDNETAISNMERAQLVADQGAEICVRIHANGDDSHTMSGALSMSPSAQNPYVSYLYEDSSRLSQCIIDSYCQATGFANLGVQYTDTMTGINWSTIPVTILEMGFMTHEYDDTKMADAQFQDTMVQGIADGIDAYFSAS